MDSFMAKTSRTTQSKGINVLEPLHIKFNEARLGKYLQRLWLLLLDFLPTYSAAVDKSRLVNKRETSSVRSPAASHEEIKTKEDMVMESALELENQNTGLINTGAVHEEDEESKSSD